MQEFCRVGEHSILSWAQRAQIFNRAPAVQTRHMDGMYRNQFGLGVWQILRVIHSKSGI